MQLILVHILFSFHNVADLLDGGSILVYFWQLGFNSQYLYGGVVSSAANHFSDDATRLPGDPVGTLQAIVRCGITTPSRSSLSVIGIHLRSWASVHNLQSLNLHLLEF